MYQNSKVRMTSMAERIAAQEDNNTNERLLKYLSGELSGIEDYLELAKEMTSDKVVHECLVAMAKDEYTHAEFIMSLLEEQGSEISEDCINKFNNLKKEIYQFHT